MGASLSQNNTIIFLLYLNKNIKNEKVNRLRVRGLLGLRFF